MRAVLRCMLAIPVLGMAAGASAGPIDEAADRFFTARDAASLRAAVDAARAAAPASAAWRSLAAQLAILEADPGAAVDHLAAALRDPADRLAALHLALLDQQPLAAADRDRVTGLYRDLARGHPDPAVRAAAATYLSAALRIRGDRDASAGALAGTGLLLPLAVTGCWDNDQGKGFDAPHPPEDDIDLRARYPGSLLEIGWRAAAPDASGGEDLADRMSPATWSVAYAAAAVSVPAEGDYEVRLTTSDPFRLWVNGTVVLDARVVKPSDWVADAFAVPVRLRKGTNRILVKSAQQEGPWSLRVRLAAAGGGVPAGVVPVPADTPVSPGPAPGSRATLAVQMDRGAASLPPGPAREWLAAAWGRWIGLREESVAAMQEFVHRHPGSVAGRYLLAAELWDKGERDRAADLLSELDASAGGDLPLLRLQRARFLSQQGLKQSARKALLSVREAHPALAEGARRLADHLGDEGWTEDRCRALQDAERLRPGVTAVAMQLGACLESLKHPERAERWYRRVLEDRAGWIPAMSEMADLALAREDLKAAEGWVRRRVEFEPNAPGSWMRLAEVMRRRGDRGAAEEAVRRAIDLSPDRADTYRLLGRIAWEDADRDATLAAWGAAMQRDPKDENLANRLEFMSPPGDEDWAGDVPGPEALEAAVEARAKVTPLPGADVVMLLDHMVTDLRPDGSTASVVTSVEMAVNQEGVDALTRYRMGGDRVRLLRAFAVDPSGKRAEASSIRGKEVLFRGLKPGSVVVVQHRADDPPVGYLARHLARTWWFGAPGRQVLTSRFVLWLAAGTRVHEYATGPVTADERRSGDRVRRSWTARDVAPLLPEPQMPPMADVAPRLLLSTVPDWDSYLKWEDALLDGAFRESPEIAALAARLFEGAAGAEEKVRRIHEFLVLEVRYQQDYESHIAGVKPHPAPMVLERKYGDCKDKSVLFITLARAGGIDARFALIRTRDAGAVVEAVPMQQFNHAVVFVPAQEGIREGRFWDPTADALDLDALRSDVPGTRSLVYDTRTRSHEWRDVPFQPPEVHRMDVAVSVRLERSGAAAGSASWTGAGGYGSWLRRTARNADKLAQSLRQEVGRLLSGGGAKDVVADEVVSLRRPAVVRAAIESSAAARVSGRELRLEVPVGWRARDALPIGERKQDVVLMSPYSRSWDVRIDLPRGARVVRKPPQGSVVARCFRFERSVAASGATVRVRQSFESLCSRIPVVEYPEHRARVEEIDRMLGEDLVLSM